MATRRERDATGVADELRGAAEERLEQADSLVVQKHSASEMQRLVHELQVHQIELELQNEELVRARTEVEQGLARYAELYEHAPVGYLTLGRDGSIRQVNLTGARLLGQERSRLVGARLGLQLGAEHHTAFQAFVTKVFDTRMPERCELVVRGPAAAGIDIELTATASDDAQECRVVLADITARKRAEALLEARLRLRELAATHSLDELLRAAMYELQRLTQSPVAYCCFVEADALSLRTWSTRIPGAPLAAQVEERDHRVNELDTAARCLRERVPVICGDHDVPMPRKAWRPDGTHLWRELAVPVLRKDSVVAIVCVANKASDYTGEDRSAVEHLADVTWQLVEQKHSEQERQELQAQLAQSRQLEAIGTLAGGLAHDFNNILQGVLSGLSVLELRLSNHHAEIEEMKGLALRGADLSKQLLGVAVRGKYDVKPVDVARVLETTSALLGRTRKNISIARELGSDLWPALMDHAQLEQVLLNLFVNAGQAMPDGGELRLRARNVEVGAEEAGRCEVSPGRYIELVVDDTGVGMDAATQARIFEPFFTTKDLGQGTGLGLASVYGIVRSHGGSIRVESAPGRGAHFTLLLPASDEPLATRPPSTGIAQRGTETILIVDDEVAIGRICSRLLRSLGYGVLIARSGSEAIEIARQHGDRIALVILDMIMPGMGGRETYDALKAIAPGIRALLSSGYSLDSQVAELLAHGGNGFLQKPYDATTLSAKVREILDA